MAPSGGLFHDNLYAATGALYVCLLKSVCFFCFTKKTKSWISLETSKKGPKNAMPFVFDVKKTWLESSFPHITKHKSMGFRMFLLLRM